MAQDPVTSNQGGTVTGVEASDWLSGWRLDAVVVGLSVLIIAGVAWDFRVHATGVSFAEEGFLTASHVFFYSMFLVLAATIIAATVHNHEAGEPSVAAIPRGYALGIVGVGLFAIAGGGDFLWHSTFGFEEGIEGLTSPTHLMLGGGAVLFLGSPLRAARYRQSGEHGSTLPALVSGTLVVTVVALFTSWANPFMQLYALGPREFLVMAHGIASYVLYSVLLVGGALVLWRDLDLPFGAVTLLFSVVGVTTMAITATLFLIPTVLVGGLLGDLLLWAVEPSVDEPIGIRVFGAIVPAVLFAAYFAVLYAQFGVLRWSVEVVSGAVVLAGVTGLFVSYLAVPSAQTRAVLAE